MTYPTGEKIEYQWDADSRLTLVRDWNGGKHTVQYAGNDRGYILHGPNGLDTHTRLNDLGLTESIVVAWQSSSVFSLGYAYDQEDRVSVLSDSAFGERAFRYDAEGQLLVTRSQNDELKESFQYDAAGNTVQISGKIAQFDAANQMLSQGHSRFSYDGRGNLVSMITVEGIWRFTHNGRNHMVRSESPDGKVTSYAYDAYGRRVRKTSGEVAVEFIWAGEQLIGEIVKTGDTVVRRDYLYFPGTFTPLAMRVGGKVYSYHTDHLGTPRLLSAPDGSIVWAAGYSSFGQTRISRATVENPLRAPGQYFDNETGLHYNRFRYYSPVMGRYLSRDPLSLLAGSNFYRYAGNNPINRADPLGLLDWGSVAMIAAKASAVVAAVAVGAAVTIALAPIALPLAIILGGAAAGAVGFGLNEYLAHGFCIPCILKEMARGAAIGILASLPFAIPAALGIAVGATAFMGLGGLSGAIGYFADWKSCPLTPWSWTGFWKTVAFSAVTAGALRFVMGAATARSAADTPTTEAPSASNEALASRANEIHGKLDPIAQTKRTTAVASVTDANGNSSIRVGSSANTLTPAQRAALLPGETPVSGPGHAEVTVINAAQNLGMQVNAVAASRPICPDCAQAIQAAGAGPASPLKQP
jgi:RHS repeat-associated protein